jgi:hypothetical protein
MRVEPAKVYYLIEYNQTNILGEALVIERSFFIFNGLDYRLHFAQLPFIVAFAILTKCQCDEFVIRDEVAHFLVDFSDVFIDKTLVQLFRLIIVA